MSLQACQIPSSIERRSSVKSRWDETHFLILLGPSLCVGTSERQIPFLFLSKVPLGRPFSVSLIKADKKQKRNICGFILALIFHPLELYLISILFSTRYLLFQILPFLICHCCGKVELYRKPNIFFWENELLFSHLFFCQRVLPFTLQGWSPSVARG